jgi:hypothetical protein
MLVTQDPCAEIRVLVVVALFVEKRLLGKNGLPELIHCFSGMPTKECDQGCCGFSRFQAQEKVV